MPSKFQPISRDHTTEAAAIAAICEIAEQVQTFKVGDVDVFRNPKDGSITRLDEHRLHPYRHHNLKLKAAEVESFCRLVRHYDKMPAVVHLIPDKLCIVCVLNHSTGEKPDWHDATITWQMHLDPFLKKWLEKDGIWLSQTALMEFLEDRLEDVAQNTAVTQSMPTGPSQSELMGVVSNLRITSDCTFTSEKNLHNGNYVFHSSRNDKAEVEVPSMFYVGLPYFDGDARAHFLFPIRLRYRLDDDGKLRFQMNFHNLDKIKRTAWEGVVATISGPLEDIPMFTMAESS